MGIKTCKMAAHIASETCVEVKPEDLLLGRLIFILCFPGLHEKLYLDHVLKNKQLTFNSFLKLHNGAIYEAFMTFQVLLNIAIILV